MNRSYISVYLFVFVPSILVAVSLLTNQNEFSSVVESKQSTTTSVLLIKSRPKHFKLSFNSVI